MSGFIEPHYRDFTDRKQYDLFLFTLFKQLNAGRKERFRKEHEQLRRLPQRRIETCKKTATKVGPSSTININHNTYSVDSRLVGEKIQVHLHMDHLEIWYGQRKVDAMPRLRGEGNHAINYRHIIDSLVRKPGAFENYRYRDDLFPTTRYRVAYDSIRKHHTLSAAAKQYLSILHMAARISEAAVDDALRALIDADVEITDQRVEAIIESGQPIAPVTQINIADVDLTSYDQLLGEVAAC